MVLPNNFSLVRYGGVLFKRHRTTQAANTEVIAQLFRVVHVWSSDRLRTYMNLSKRDSFEHWALDNDERMARIPWPKQHSIRQRWFALRYHILQIPQTTKKESPITNETTSWRPTSVLSRSIDVRDWYSIYERSQTDVHFSPCSPVLMHSSALMLPESTVWLDIVRF